MLQRLTPRNFIGFTILFLVAGLVVIVVYNFRGDLPDRPFATPPHNVDLSLKQFQYTETTDGRPRWSLDADTAGHSLKEARTRIENLRMSFFDQAGSENYTLSARQGWIDTQSQQVGVAGEVVVTDREGRRFYTETLRYHSDQSLLQTDDPVRLASDRMVLTGQGLRIDVEGRRIEIPAQVLARIHASGGEGGRK